MKKLGLSSFKRRMRKSVNDFSCHLESLFCKCLSDYQKILDKSYHLYSKKLIRIFLVCSVIQTIIFLFFCFLTSKII